MATNPIKTLGSDKTYVTVTVTTAATGLSDVVDLSGYTLHSMQMSTAWTAATVTFMGAVSSSASLRSVRTGAGGTELAYTTSNGYLNLFGPSIFTGIRYLQLRSGSTASPVAQAAEREIILGLASRK